MLIYFFSLSLFFRAPSFILWLIVPMGCIKERCMQPVQLTFLPPILSILTLKTNPETKFVKKYFLFDIIINFGRQ